MLGSVAVLAPLVVVLWVFSVGDVLATPRADVRRLSKRRWLLLTLLLPLIGSVAWIVAGRPVTRPRRGHGGDRPATVITDADIREFLTALCPQDAADAEDTEDTAAFRRRCRERAQEQRRRYAAQQRHGRSS